LAEYYTTWKSENEPKVVSFADESPLSPDTLYQDIKPSSPVKPFRPQVAKLKPTPISPFPEYSSAPRSPPVSIQSTSTPPIRSPSPPSISEESSSIISLSEGIPPPNRPKRSDSITRLDQINQDFREFQEEVQGFHFKSVTFLDRFSEKM